jgi:S-formylglutathione hydrolase FrmB
MVKRALLAVVLIAAFVPVRSGAADSPAPCPTASPDAEGRLRDVLLSGTAIGITRVCILLPGAYSPAGPRYPVLYLLHGAGDDQTKWMANTDVEEATKDLGLIVVMPDGGRSPDAGWYTDWVSGPKWETYHITQLVPYIDAHFNTVASRSGRAIAGLSMGGFGAMSYAARHPDLFVSAGSFSGAVDTADGGPAEALVYKQLHNQFGTPDERVWGDYTTDEVRWRAHNPPDLSTNLRGMQLSLTTGNGIPMPGDSPASSPTETGVYTQNLTFHGDLMSDATPHAWNDRHYGTHEWHYWQQDLHDYLAALMPVFAAPPAAPAPLDYRSAEPVFDVWGYHFAVAGRALEFLDVSRASAAGMRLHGSGSVDITTPALYEAGKRYQVTVYSSKSSDSGAVTADPSGRLRFAANLGPGHTSQQYTIDGRLAELAGGPDYWTDATVEIYRLP